MSTLFLIGNGFDINCGMQTKYINVYEKYINEVSPTNTIKKFKKNISADFETWGDFEMAMARYAQHLNGESEFLECIRDFAIYMERYLIEENTRVKKLINDTIILEGVVKEMEQSLNNFYTDISHNIDMAMDRRNVTSFRNFEAISFNYTDVFDVLWNTVLKKYKIRVPVTHIHGLLQDGPVFGVDSINQIKTNYELTKKGRRGFIKPVFNSEYDEQRVVEAKRKIENALTICVYGMSLGDSDLSWRNEIMNWLKVSEQHHLFIYRYSLSNVKYFTVAEKMDIEDDAKEQLLKEWGIEEGMLLNQIHIPCGKNIFNVEMIIKEELRKYGIRKEIELKEKIEQGEWFTEQYAKDIIMT